MLQNYFYKSTLSTQDKQIKSIYDNYHEIINKYIHKESPLCIKHQDFGDLQLTVYYEPFHIYLNEANQRIIGTYGINIGLYLFLDTGIKIYNPDFDFEWVTQNSTPILIDSFQKHNYKLVTIHDIKIDLNRSFFKKHYFGTTYNYNLVITDKDMQEQYIRDHYLLIDYTGKSIKYYSKKIEHLHYQDGKINRREIIKDITQGYEEWRKQEKRPKIINCVNPYSDSYSDSYVGKSGIKNNKKLFFEKRKSKLFTKESTQKLNNTTEQIIRQNNEIEEWTILSNNPEPIKSSIYGDFTSEDLEFK